MRIPIDLNPNWLRLKKGNKMNAAAEFLRKAFHVDSSLSLVEYFGNDKEFKIHDVVRLMNNYTDSLQSKNKELSDLIESGKVIFINQRDKDNYYKETGSTSND